MSQSLRTFVAVEISPGVRAAAQHLIRELSAAPAKVKWVEPENLHWTLKFLGQVSYRDSPHVCRAVAKAVANLPEFVITAGGAGAFPNGERPRTIWLGVNEGTAEMIALHEAVEAALEPLGFRREHRRFRPHLTIGRVRNSPLGIEELGALVEAHKDFAAASMDVSEVSVFSSQLDEEGARYELLAHAPLGQIAKPKGKSQPKPKPKPNPKPSGKRKR